MFNLICGFCSSGQRFARGLFPHPASFRFHLAMDTLAFGCILPATGRIRVFHPLETCAAGRTVTKHSPPKIGGLCFLEQYNLTQLSVTIFSFLHLTNQSFFERTEENATLLFSFFATVRQIQHTQPHHRSNHQTRVQEQMSAITGLRCLRVSIFDCAVYGY